MKAKNKENLIILLVFFPVLLWLTLTFTDDNEKSFKPYTVFNKGEKGVSVTYEALKELGYTANLILTEVESQAIGSAQIVIEPKRPYKVDLNNENIKNWIRGGGVLIYLIPNWDEMRFNYGTEIDSYTLNGDKHAKAYSYDKGLLVIGNPDIINNKTLTINTEGAYWLLTQINKMDINNISFNEFYHYFEGQKPSLWRDIPAGIKLTIYQVIIVIAIVIYYYGKRFGKVIPLYEEVERVENEYIYSAASLFKRGELREDVILNLHDDFLCSFEDSYRYNKSESWISIWEREKLPDMNMARKLYDYISNMNDNKKISSKEMLEIVGIIEHLKKIVDKGREVHWREQKRDIQSI